MKVEKLPKKNMTIRERKIWGRSGLFLWIGGFLLILLGSFEPVFSERIEWWLTGLTAVVVGFSAVVIAMVEKIWAYIAQNTDMETEK